MKMSLPMFKHLKHHITFLSSDDIGAHQTVCSMNRKNLLFAALVAGMLLAASLAIVLIYMHSEHIAITYLRVDGNDDLTEDNGVTSGDGTADNPFVIEGLAMSFSQGIDIANTDAWLVIRNISLDNTSGTTPAIEITSVSNLVLDNVTVNQAWDGIRISNSRDCRVGDCVVSSTAAGSGLALSNCLNITAVRNLFRVTGWGLFGAIEVIDSRECQLSNNTITETPAGIRVADSEECVFFSNEVNTTGWGINIESSRNLTLRGNTFTRQGVQFSGAAVEDFSAQAIADDNLLNGKPIVYKSDEQGLTISDVAVGEMIIANCRDTHIFNVQIDNASAGVYLYYCSDALIENVSVSGHGVDHLESFTYGIKVEQGSNVSLMSNWISETGGGIRCSASSAVLSLNYINAFATCTSLGLVDATISNNTFEGQSGIMMLYGSDIVIANNSFLNCSAMAIDLNSVSNVVVVDNTMIMIHAGTIARLVSVSHALFYHNEFLDFREGVIFDASENCLWDSGYPGGGNYWSDYGGQDEFSGPGQDVSGPDGIGDTPYVISETLGIHDSYPLMNPAS